MWNYQLKVYKKGKLIRTEVYENYSGNAMMDLVKDLKKNIFKPKDGFTLEFDFIGVYNGIS